MYTLKAEGLNWFKKSQGGFIKNQPGSVAKKGSINGFMRNKLYKEPNVVHTAPRWFNMELT